MFGPELKGGPMLQTILLILSLSWSFTAFADDLELPQDLEVYKAGYVQAPVIQCPKTAKKYVEMLEQLDGLKQKIRKEACPQSQLESLNKEVAGLETVITDGRESFVNLVQKGLGENHQLTSKEVEKLQKYIDQVVKKVASVTGLISNPACFDENEKVSTLSFLSSIVGEVAGVVGAISGPFGAKISLGGKLAAGLIGSIDQVVQARKTYDYDNREDRNNYQQNLCAYFEFKGDLDKETKVLTYGERLWDMADAADVLLNNLEQTCSECRGVIRDFSSRVGRNQDFQVVMNGDGNLTAGHEDETQARRPEDMTLRNIYDYYFQDGNDLTSDIILGHDPEGQQNPITSSRPAQEMRVMTIRALQAKAWFDMELEVLQENDNANLADDGRREVMRVQKSIEDFLVQREGPRFIGYYTDVLRRDMRALENEAYQVVTRLRLMWAEPDPEFDYYNKKYNATLAFHDLFRNNLIFSDKWGATILPEQQDQILGDVRQNLVNHLESVRLDHSILESRCLFFEKSSFDYMGSLRSSCETASRELAKSKQLMNELLQTSFAKRHSPKLSFVNAEVPNYTQDWLDSITHVLRNDLAFL